MKKHKKKKSRKQMILDYYNKGLSIGQIEKKGFMNLEIQNAIFS